jgi:hypothetical protein
MLTHSEALLPRSAFVFPAAIVGILLLVLVGYSLPMWQPVYTEGYSYYTQALGRLLLDHTLPRADSAWLFAAEFYYYTRPGAVLLTGLAGTVGLSYVDVLPLFSLAAIVFSVLFVHAYSVSCAQAAWSPWSMSLLAVCLVPVIMESGYFANDNIIGYAFGIAAAWLVARPKVGRASLVAAGGLAALSAFVRPDSILFTSLVAGIAFYRSQSIKEGVVRIGLILAGVAGVFEALHLIEAALGVPPSYLWLRFRVAKRVLSIWNPAGSVIVFNDVKLMVGAFGAGLLLIGAGGVLFFADRLKGILAGQTLRAPLTNLLDHRRLREAALLVGMLLAPAAFLLFSLGKLFDPRAGLAYAPMALVLIHRVLVHALSWSQPQAGPLRRAEAFTVGALCAVTLFAPTPLPPWNFATLELPRSLGLTARAFAYPAWREWKRPFLATHAASQRLLAAIEGDDRPAVVVAVDWTQSRPIYGDLLEAGFRPMPERKADGCSSESTTLAKGPLAVELISQPPFQLGELRDLRSSVWVTAAAECVARRAPDRRYVYDAGSDIQYNAWWKMKTRPPGFSSVLGLADMKLDGTPPTLSDADLHEVEAIALRELGCAGVEACAGASSAYAPYVDQLPAALVLKHPR